MKIALQILLVVSYLTGYAQGEFEVQSQNDLVSAVRNNFIKQGQCVNVTNIQSIGSSGNVGTFRGGKDLLQMDSGIVFSTGFLNNIAGRNILPDNTGQLNQGSDPDLQRIAVQPVQDAVGFEFDFVPNAGRVTFDYVFASEEYCEFVDDIFNDVFGFFVSGPGIEGTFSNQGINVANVPNTDDKVSINTINHKLNREFFVSNITRPDAEQCNLEFRPDEVKPIEFDGYTTRLRASIEVVPCETYHLRLVVGDVADDILDSGVFLAANSFDLGTAVDVTSWVGDTIGDTFYEDCLDAKFVFTRNLVGRGTSTIEFNYTLSGTATQGVDYESLPGVIRITGSDATGEVPIKVISDNLSEGTESIILVVEFFSCDCIERDTSILYLGDSDYPFAVDLDTLRACRSQPVEWQPKVEGGAGPFKYLWSTGDTTEVLTIDVESPAEFTIAVEDFCGRVATDQAPFLFKPVPNASIEEAPFFCLPNQQGAIGLRFEGEAPWSLSYEVGGQEYTIQDIHESSFTLPIFERGPFVFTNFSDINCVGIIPDDVTAALLDLDFSIVLTNPTCLFASDGSISIDATNNLEMVSINLGKEQSVGALQVADLKAGKYPLRVFDGKGCERLDTVQLGAPSSVQSCADLLAGQMYIPNAFTPNGDGTNDVFRLYPQMEFITEISYDIYNRWGGLVFQSQNFHPSESKNHFWDGGSHGISIYAVSVHLKLIDESRINLASDVFLMR